MIKEFLFDEIFDDITSKIQKIPKSEYLSSGEIAIIDQSQNYIAGYSNLRNINYQTQLPRIIFGDHTRIFKYVDIPFYIGADGVKVLELKNNEIDYKYIYNYLLHSFIPNEGYSRHYKWLKKLSFKIPSIEKQKLVVKELEKISIAIQNRKEAIEIHDQLIESEFYNMFGTVSNNFRKYNVDTISNACVLKSGTTFKSEEELDYGPLMYAKVSDMNLSGNEKYIFRTKKYVNLETAGKTIIPSGCVIFPKRGAAIATNKKRISTEAMCVDLNIMAIIPKERVMVEYLYYYFKRLDMGELYNGSSIPQINNVDINPLKIVIPPILEQKKFTKIVEEIEKQKKIIHQDIEELESLLEITTNKYFL